MSLALDGRGDGVFACFPRAYLIILGALLRYNRVPSLPKVYSPRQISTARRLPKGVFFTSIEAGATYQ